MREKNENLFLTKLCSRNSAISIIISLLMSIASLFFKSGIIPAIVILIITFLLTLITIEVLEYIVIIERDKKYITFYEKFGREGISNYFSDFTNMDIKSNLKMTKKVCIVEIYSSKNIINNYDNFKKFLADKDNSLEVILLNPEIESSQYKYLISKFSYEKDKIKSRVDELITHLRNIKNELQGNCGKVTVYYSNYIPQYSMIMFDNLIYVTFYKTAPGRSNEIPAFEVVNKSNSTFYKFLIDDYSDLKKYSISKEEI